MVDASKPRAPEKLTFERGYTTKDFTALRAYVQRIAAAVIARTYYDPDDDPHAATPGATERHLNTMLDTLVTLALAHGSSVLAEHLRASIRQNGHAKLTSVTFRMVTEAAQLAALPPHPDHAIGAWLRPRIARRLTGEGITTLGELVAYCNRRGGSWWRSIPRIGPGRARTIISWLRRQQAAQQLTIEADVDSAEQVGVPLVAAELIEVAPALSLDREKKQTASRLHSRHSNGWPCRTRSRAPMAKTARPPSVISRRVTILMRCAPI